MVIDCGRCAKRGTACTDCVITVIERQNSDRFPGRESVDLDATEMRALRVLAEAEMLPPLRLSLPGGRLLPGARAWAQRVLPDSKAS
jgi:hypothetical protein